MAKTSSDILVETLARWGVDTVFGIPGDGVGGVIEGLRTHQDRIRFIHTRHEEAAAFMACAYAKYSGRLGCCLGTSGPGGIHLLNGLYDAKLDGVPVLAITGMQFHDLIGTHTQQDVELDKLYMDVAVYDERVMGRAHVENVTELACRTALSRRGVAHITIPIDIQEESGEDSSRRSIPSHVSDVLASSARLPRTEDLKAAAEILNRGRKITILCGAGALGAGDLLEEAAEIMGAPIIKALLGKAVVADDSPYTTGGIGLLGTEPSQIAMESCDTLLIVGSSFPYIEYMPKPGQCRAVQIDLDPVRIGLRYPVEVGIVGDSRRVLLELIPMLQRKEDRSFLNQAQEGMAKWWKLMEERGTRQTKPMKPQVLAWELGRALPENAIVSCDSGTIATWWARQMRVKKGQMHSLSGTLATMANGLPYAIGAQVAFPERPCVAFVGDGGFSMLMAEFSTAVKYRLPIKVFVVDNHTLGQIKWEQMVLRGNPEYGCDLEPIDFAAFARACGGTGIHLEEPADAPGVVELALNTPGPVVVDAIVDPFEPPMPARVTARQAARFTEALVRGEPSHTTLTVAKDKVRELI